MKKDTKVLKRKLRHEKKCQKLSALLVVSKLNADDRAKKNEESTTVTNDSEPAAKRLCVEPTKTDSLNDGKLREIGGMGKSVLNGEEYVKLKQQLKEHRAAFKVLPKFRLRENGQQASLEIEKEERIPLFLPDIQHLLLYSQIGHHSPYAPSRWCQLDKFNKLNRTNVLIVENVSLYHFQSYENCFTYLKEHFPYKLELISPEANQGDIVQDLATVPLTGQHTKTLISEYGSLETAVVHSPDVFDRINGVFPQQKQRCSGLPPDENFSRTDLLLSGWQMVDENFPMPIKGLTENKYAGYVLTKDSYKDVTASSPMFGVDCEMCLTSAGSELTRVSVIDENCRSIYETLVKPILPITDYLTRYSGITPKMMKNVTKRLTEVQQDLRKILPADAILVGQSLNNDFHALQIMHPYVIDTSVIYNVTGDRKRKTKLQTLAREFLDMRIQDSRKGHCSMEDSIASLMLVKHKLKHDVTFGDAVSGNISTHVNCYTALGNPNFGTSFFKRITKIDKTAQIVAPEGVILNYQHYTYKENEQRTDKLNYVAADNDEVVEKLTKTAAKYTFNAAHVFVSDDELNKDSRSVCRKIDKWVKDMHINSKNPELFIVIFGGQRKFGNGCCFISMKNCRW